MLVFIFCYIMFNYTNVSRYWNTNIRFPQRHLSNSVRLYLVKDLFANLNWIYLTFSHTFAYSNWIYCMFTHTRQTCRLALLTQISPNKNILDWSSEIVDLSASRYYATCDLTLMVLFYADRQRAFGISRANKKLVGHKIIK